MVAIRSQTTERQFAGARGHRLATSLSGAYFKSTSTHGYRIGNWKKQLQESLVDPFNLEVMVCHYPTGTSKWNPIEYRLFSFISLNWSGVPLPSLNIMLNLIRGTTTDAGLKVQAAVIRRGPNHIHDSSNFHKKFSQR